MMDETLRLYHQSAVSIWEQFCRLHQELYELTCDEYQSLLCGEIEGLEELIAKKDLVISQISAVEAHRAELIREISHQGIGSTPIQNVTGLLDLLAPLEAQMSIPALRNLNALLIDIIGRIQEQNKKNQIFLNKAMASLKDIREGFSGKKQYTTYGANGMTRSAGR